MRPEEALALPNSVLVDLYREWSEETYCAGWMSGGEEEFVRWLVEEKRFTKHSHFRSYEEKSIRTIRDLLEYRMGIISLGPVGADK